MADSGDKKLEILLRALRKVRQACGGELPAALASWGRAARVNAGRGTAADKDLLAKDFAQRIRKGR